jgi:hypothetical protein
MIVTLTILVLIGAMTYRIMTKSSQGERVVATLIDARESAQSGLAHVVDDLRDAGFGVDPTALPAIEVASQYRITFLKNKNKDGTIGPGERITYFLDTNANDSNIKDTANPNDRVLRRVVSSASNPEATPGPGKGQIIAIGLTQRSGASDGWDIPLFTYWSAHGDSLVGAGTDPTSADYGKTLDGAALGIPGGLVASDVAMVRTRIVTEATYKDPWSRKFNNAETVGTSYINGENPVLGKGLWGIHIDVDTSHLLYPFGSGTTDAHHHEWDDDFDTNKIDYFSLMDVNLHEIFEDITDPNTKFKIILANANLSPGADITVNGMLFRVTTYDDIAISDLPILTLGGSGGTTKLTELRMTFDRASGLKGNVHPTVTGSVRGNDPGQFGEWRNGALTVQAIRVKDDGTPLSPTNVALSAGGVQGVATGNLLWESTVFWHWQGPAYGQAGWSTYVP